MKQNNFVQSSSPMVLTCISLVVLYSIYGLGPFTDMEQKIKNREEMQKNGLVKQEKSMVTKVDWAEGGPEHHFWTNTTSCKDFKTRFAKVNTLPIRALASFPGSGNTWVRYLIEGATGVYTGSIFNDRSILRAGHYGEGRDYKDGSTIMQKTHHRSLYLDKYKGYELKWRETHIMTFQGRAVLVVRNPYKAILSYWNFFTTQSHTNTISEHSFESFKFKDFVFTGASRWFEVISDWINMGNDVYFIFYEDLVEDPVREMRKLIDYLGFPVIPIILKDLFTEQFIN